MQLLRLPKQNVAWLLSRKTDRPRLFPRWPGTDKIVLCSIPVNSLTSQDVIPVTVFSAAREVDDWVDPQPLGSVVFLHLLRQDVVRVSPDVE